MPLILKGKVDFMRSVRMGTFETNSSSTHSLSICNSYYNEEIVDIIPKGADIILGEYSGADFLDCSESTRYSGFMDKLHCFLAFLICYYEDKVEYWNSENLQEQFEKSCHYLWICELLKEKYDINLSLRDFRYSGVSMEDDLFGMLQLPIFYPSDYKERVDEILTNPDIILEYTCESW